jgi:signal transduction histidine kinase
VRTFDVREAIERAVTLLHAHPSHSPGTSARVQLDPDAIPVCGDRNRLVQVFLNLGKNAFDAMAPGAMLLITARRAGEGVEIVFADEGRGMDQETLSRVFDPFYTTKAVGQGTGLGLAVAKGIVEAMSGHIGIESEVGKGTTVTVLLPLASDTEAKAAA